MDDELKTELQALRRELAAMRAEFAAARRGYQNEIAEMWAQLLRLQQLDAAVRQDRPAAPRQ